MIKYLICIAILLISCGDSNIPGRLQEKNDENKRTFSIPEQVFLPYEESIDDGDSDLIESEEIIIENNEEEIDSYVPRNCYDKILLCHTPPGNPEKRHELCLDKHATQIHLTKHGDYLGGCQD